MFVWLLALFSVPAFVLTDELFRDRAELFKLTASNFNSLVTEDKGLWVVMFYADWCGHCKNFAPHYADAAKKLEGLVKFGVVDAQNEAELSSKYQIKGFPTVKVFGRDKKTPDDYKGPRSVDGLISTISEIIKSAAGSKQESSSTSDVVILTDDNFDEIVLKSEKPFLVKFFAPWCGHCKSMEGAFKEAATAAKSKVSLGEVDATVHQKLAQRFGIQGYPTLKYFTKETGETGEDYNAGRSKDEIIDWLEAKVGDFTVKPQVKQIVDQSSFDDCMSKKFCVLAFLPMDEDTTDVQRKEHIKLLKDVMIKTNTGGWGWYWNIGATNDKLETALAIDEMSYPFFIGIYKDKEAYTVLRSGFEMKPMMSFINDIKNGKTTYSTLPKVLHKFETVKPFARVKDEL